MKSILLVNKPSGMTSHDVVELVRSKFKINKVGHAGTLDPDAQGLLILLLGKATKSFSRFSSLTKQYLVEIKFGETTDTLDKKGEVVKEAKNHYVPQGKLKKAIEIFKGSIEQIPPMYSAVKYNGRKLYELAREGKEVKREPRKIEIYEMNLVEYKYPIVKIRIKCSKGTYTRSICRDLGEKVKVPAYQYNLIRERIGRFDLSKAVSVKKLKKTSNFEIKNFCLGVDDL